MLGPQESLVGTVWDAKDETRCIRIERDFVHLSVRMFDIINLETRRVTGISLAGLERKFVRRLT